MRVFLFRFDPNLIDIEVAILGRVLICPDVTVVVG